jgi:hypothetical protein
LGVEPAPTHEKGVQIHKEGVAAALFVELQMLKSAFARCRLRERSGTLGALKD